MPPMREMKLQDLKSKTPDELTSFAEEHQVENASTMRKQELMFAILKQLATQEIDIIGEGVVEVLSDGFGFLRSPESNYLSGPDDIYVSPSQIRRFGLRTGDTVEGPVQEVDFRPRHRHRVADRQGPARAHRVAAAHRQDRAAAEHRARHHRQSSGMLSDRAVDRRAAGGSHRHAALGQGRGDLLDLRRAGLAPRAG